MSAWWDEDHKLLLITPEEFAALPDGTLLTCINDKTVVKGTDHIYDDTRGGHIGYGVTGDHPLRVAQLEKLASQPKPEPVVIPDHEVWTCKIGIMGNLNLPAGSDHPMRRAVERAFFDLTGVHAEFNFSGWGSKLDPDEYEVVKS